MFVSDNGYESYNERKSFLSYLLFYRTRHPSFFHAFYAICIHYQRFHSVNLTLHRITSIHSMQLKSKIQLETRKQDESCQKIQDPRKKERNQVGKEKSLSKMNR